MNESKKRSTISKSAEKQIDSIALALTFVVLGLVLTFIPQFFGDEFVTNILRWIFVFLGLVGFASSFNNKDSQISGTTDIALGVLFLIIGIAAFSFISAPWGGIISIVVLLFGIFGTLRGVLILLYTTNRMLKQRQDHGRSSNTAAILELLTKLAALTMVIIQIAQLGIPR